MNGFGGPLSSSMSETTTRKKFGTNLNRLAKPPPTLAPPVLGLSLTSPKGDLSGGTHGTGTGTGTGTGLLVLSSKGSRSLLVGSSKHAAAPAPPKAAWNKPEAPVPVPMPMLPVSVSVPMPVAVSGSASGSLSVPASPVQEPMPMRPVLAPRSRSNVSEPPPPPPSLSPMMESQQRSPRNQDTRMDFAPSQHNHRSNHQHQHQHQHHPHQQKQQTPPRYNHHQNHYNNHYHNTSHPHSNTYPHSHNSSNNSNSNINNKHHNHYPVPSTIETPKEVPIPDQSEYMRRRAREVAEERRKEEEQRATERRERTARRLRELEQSIPKDEVVLEPLTRAPQPQQRKEKALFDPSTNVLKTYSKAALPPQKAHAQPPPSPPHSVIHVGSMMEDQPPPIAVIQLTPTDDNDNDNGLLLETDLGFDDPTNHTNTSTNTNMNVNASESVNCNNSHSRPPQVPARTSAGPRMLFDPKSGALVEASCVVSSENNHNHSHKKSEKPRTNKSRRDRAESTHSEKSSHKKSQEREASSPADTGGKYRRKNSNNANNNGISSKKERKHKAGGDHKASSSSYNTKQKNQKPKMPRTCGVLYRVDEHGNYVSVDGCEADQGYGAHSVPGGRVRNPMAHAQFVKEQRHHQHQANIKANASTSIQMQVPTSTTVEGENTPMAVSLNGYNVNVSSFHPSSSSSTATSTMGSNNDLLKSSSNSYTHNFVPTNNGGISHQVSTATTAVNTPFVFTNNSVVSSSPSFQPNQLQGYDIPSQLRVKANEKISIITDSAPPELQATAHPWSPNQAALAAAAASESEELEESNNYHENLDMDMDMDMDMNVKDEVDVAAEMYRMIDDLDNDDDHPDFSSDNKNILGSVGGLHLHRGSEDESLGSTLNASFQGLSFATDSVVDSILLSSALNCGNTTNSTTNFLDKKSLLTLDDTTIGGGGGGGGGESKPFSSLPTLGPSTWAPAVFSTSSNSHQKSATTFLSLSPLTSTEHGGTWSTSGNTGHGGFPSLVGSPKTNRVANGIVM